MEEQIEEADADRTIPYIENEPKESTPLKRTNVTERRCEKINMFPNYY